MAIQLRKEFTLIINEKTVTITAEDAAQLIDLLKPIAALAPAKAKTEAKKSLILEEIKESRKDDSKFPSTPVPWPNDGFPSRPYQPTFPSYPGKDPFYPKVWCYANEGQALPSTTTLGNF